MWLSSTADSPAVKLDFLQKFNDKYYVKGTHILECFSLGYKYMWPLFASKYVVWPSMHCIYVYTVYDL